MHKLIDFYPVIVNSPSVRPTFGNSRIKALKMLNALGADIYVRPRTKRVSSPTDMPKVSHYFNRWRFAVTETRLSKFVVDGELMRPGKISGIISGRANTGHLLQSFIDRHSHKYQFYLIDDILLEPTKAVFNTGKFWFHISGGTTEEKTAKFEMLAAEAIRAGASRFWSLTSIAKHLDTSGLKFAIDDKPVEWDRLRQTSIKLYDVYMEDANYLNEYARSTWGQALREWFTDRRYTLGPPIEYFLSFLFHGDHKLSIVDHTGETLYRVKSRYNAEETGDGYRRSIAPGTNKQQGMRSLLEEAGYTKNRR